MIISILLKIHHGKLSPQTTTWCKFFIHLTKESNGHKKKYWSKARFSLRQANRTSHSLRSKGDSHVEGSGMLVMSETALCSVSGFIKSSHCFKLFHNEWFPSLLMKIISPWNNRKRCFVILTDSDWKFNNNFIIYYDSHIYNFTEIYTHWVKKKAWQ